MVALNLTDTPAFPAVMERRRPFFQENPLTRLFALGLYIMPSDKVEVEPCFVVAALIIRAQAQDIRGLHELKQYASNVRRSRHERVPPRPRWEESSWHPCLAIPSPTFRPEELQEGRDQSALARMLHRTRPLDVVDQAQPLTCRIKKYRE